MPSLFASYNVFSGLELLEGSIKSIRNVVDHVNVVFQDVSNTGNKKEGVKEILKDLWDRNLIDSVVYFEPYLKLSPKQNETNKRNYGLYACKQAGADYFMSIDTDEYYNEAQLKAAFEEVHSKKYEASVCKMQTYYKTPEWRLLPPEDYYVSLFFDISQKREFKNGIIWPVHVDPSRKMPARKIKIFQRSEIEMHHFSYVRKDIREKLNNAASSPNFKNRIEEIAEYYDRWAPGYKAYLAGAKEKFYDVEKVNNQFNIQL